MLAGLGLDAEIAVVTADHDPVADVQAQSRALPDLLGREERIEDAALEFGRDSRSGVTDLDQHTIPVPAGADGQRALAVHGIDGVVDDVGPYLVELAALGADLGQVCDRSPGPR